MPKFGESVYGGSGVYVPGIFKDTAAVTHNVILDDVGLMTAGIPTRSDITSAIPRISIGSEQRRHTDFSERDTFGQKSYHHGFGEVEFSDRAKFFKSQGVLTHTPNQLTLAPSFWTQDTAVSMFSNNADGSSPFTDSNGYIVATAEFQGLTYLLQVGDTGANNKVWYWYEAADTWNKSAITAAMSTNDAHVPSDLCAFGTGTNLNLYVAHGESTNMVRLNSNLSTTASVAVPAKFLASFNGKLWRSDNVNEIYYSADPHTDGSATWTAPNGLNDGTIGDSNYPITGMIVHKSALWVGKWDGIYRIHNTAQDTSTEVWQVEKVIDLTHIISEFNGTAMMSFGGDIYFSVDRTLGKYDGTTLQYMGPDKGANPGKNFYQLQSVYDTAIPQEITTEPQSFAAGTVGVVRSLTNDGENIFAAVDSGGDVTGGSGQESRIMLYNQSGWHQLYSTEQYHTTYHDAGDYRSRFVAFIPRKGNVGWQNYSRIIIGNEAVTNAEETGVEKEDRILQMYFNRWGSNVLDDVNPSTGVNNLSFESSGYLITSWFDGGLPDIEKTFFDVTIESQNVGLGTANNNIKVEYQVDGIGGDTVWNELHQVTTVGAANNDLVTSSPTQKLTFPDNGNLDKSIYAKKIRLKFTLNRATTGSNYNYTTPILKSWGYHFVVRPESRYGWNLAIKAYDNLTDLQRRQVSKSAQEIRQYLYSKRDQKIPIIFHDGTELPQIKNWVLNPSMEYLTAAEGSAPNGYSSSSATLTTSSKYRAHGSRSMEVEPSTATADSIVTIGTYSCGLGENIFAAANMWIPDGADSVYLQVLRADGATVLAEQVFNSMSASGDYGDIYLANHTRWVRGYIFTEDIPAGEDYIFRLIRKAADAHTTVKYYVDTVEFAHNGPNNLKLPNYDYVDGDQLRCRWLGTPHNSESVRQSGYQVYITGMTESYRYPEVKQSNTTFDSEISLAIREVS